MNCLVSVSEEEKYIKFASLLLVAKKLLIIKFIVKASTSFLTANHKVLCPHCIPRYVYLRFHKIWQP